MTSYMMFTKHAEKMLKKVSDSRPILQGIYHGTDSHVVATDSHRLYKLHDGFKTEQPFTQNPKTGEYLDGNYPDTSRLFPDASDAHHSFMVNVKELHDAVKGMFAADKAINKSNRHGVVCLQKENDTFKACVGNEASAFKASYEMATVHGDDVKIYVNGNYLLDALALFKDAGEHEIKVLTYSAVRPVILESRDVSALILPVKTY